MHWRRELVACSKVVRLNRDRRTSRQRDSLLDEYRALGQLVEEDAHLAEFEAIIDMQVAHDFGYPQMARDFANRTTRLLILQPFALLGHLDTVQEQLFETLQALIVDALKLV